MTILAVSMPCIPAKVLCPSVTPSPWTERHLDENRTRVPNPPFRIYQATDLATSRVTKNDHDDPFDHASVTRLLLNAARHAPSLSELL